jgi:integrase
MEPVDLLHDWLANSALRPSTRAEYHREITSFLTWCTQQDPPVDALTARPADIATWAHDRHLTGYLNGRPFNGPDALAYLAQHHPEAARSHDRRISALTQYYEAAHNRRLITLPPDLTVLRSGVPRPPGAKKRLTRMEAAILLTCIGSWRASQSRHWQRDQLAVYLLLEGLRPAQVIRVSRHHLYPQPDDTWEVRAPDEHQNVGPKFTLQPITGSALQAYLAVRPEPSDPGEHALLLNYARRGMQSRYPNLIVGQMAATHPLLADRQPPVTADAVAHTGFWDEPQAD